MYNTRTLLEGGVSIGALTAILERMDQGVLVFLPDGMAMANAAGRQAFGVGTALFSAEVLGIDVLRVVASCAAGSQRVRVPDIETLARVEHLGSGLRVLWLDDEVRSQAMQAQVLAAVGMVGARQQATTAADLLHVMCEQVPVDTAVISLFDCDVLRPVAWHGVMLDPLSAALPADHGVLKGLRDHAEVRRSDGNEWGFVPSSGVFLVVPLWVAGQPIGALHVGLLPEVEECWSDGRFWGRLGEAFATLLERGRVHERLVDGESRLRHLIDQLPDGVVVYDGRGVVIETNFAAHRILEFVPKNLNTDERPFRIRDEAHQLMRRADWPFYRAARLGRSLFDQRLVLDYGDRIKYVDVSVLFLPGGDGRSPQYLGTLRDATEKAVASLRRDEFLSVASHELRGPLTPLTGFLQMAIAQAERGEAVDVNLIVRAERQARKMARLVDDLLDVSRIDSGQLHVELMPFDLTLLVTRLAESAGWSGRVKIDAPMPAWALVDVTRLEQVLTNLVENSLRHGMSETPVTVCVRCGESQVVLEVLDDGVGIAPEHLPNVFERFYRGSSQVSGTGIGLYVARQIVERHHGTIELSNREPRGLAVVITLPGVSH